MKTVLWNTIFFFLLLVNYAVTAQSQRITFNKVLPGEGKSFLHITGIIQDKEGYMWFASKKGLYRYDGYNVSYYKNDPLNPNSLISNSLETICLDSIQGFIWIGTFGNGLERFDPLTETFTHFQHDPKNSTGLSNDTVWALLQDSHGILWIGSPNGLDRYDPKTNKFTNYRHRPNDPTSISNNSVRTIYEDHNGTLWIGTGSPYPGDGGGIVDGGLNKMDTKTGKFTSYRNEPGNANSLINNKVGAIFEDSKGIFWVGTAGDGLHTMNRGTGAFERHTYDAADPLKLSRPPLNKTLVHDHITFIREDAAGGIWIGSSDAGVNRYDPAARKIQHFDSHEKLNFPDGHSYDDNTSWAACSSREGIFWISSIIGNLYRIDPFNRNIPFISVASNVNSFFEDSSGALWITTWKGLFKNDSINQSKKLPPYAANLPGLPQNLIRIIQDSQGNIWITSGMGLFLFDKKTQSLIRYKHDAKNNKSLSDDFVIAVYEDNHSNLWLGTFRGLDKMNRKTGEFTNYKINPLDTAGYGENMILSILEDKQGKFWVGSFSGNGIHLFDKEKGTFKNYLRGVSIRCIYDDSQNVLWAGADDGLYQYNRSLDIFSRFTDSSSSLKIDDVGSIIEDDQGNLWIASSNGILRLNRSRNESNLFGKNYGVDGSELEWSSYKGQDGKLYFGANSGYYAFFPDQLKSNSKPPTIIFSAFLLGDKVIKSGGNGPLTEPLSETKQIRLSYNQNVFSFDFIALDYTNTADNRYLFMLENYERSWRQGGSDRRASYFNVPPGKYLFRLKAANSDGVWTEKSIQIIISPPWWQTWWAYCIYGLVAISLVYIIYRIQKRNIIYKERERTKEVELAQAREIEKAYNILKNTQSQLIQAEKMASLGELTAGIAHEIQNPLNFVNNFSEVNNELIEELKSENRNLKSEEQVIILNDIYENNEKIKLHGKRADSIVKNMLQHSGTSIGAKEPTDINALCNEYLRLAYHGMRAKDKAFNAKIDTDFDSTIEKVTMVPQEIGRVILNLINNAFYAVNEKQKLNLSGYLPLVTIATKRVDGKINIWVSDNGIGIPEKNIDKIFQPFFTTKPTGQGTGLGLSLAYDIVKAHGGTITVETKEGQGSEFKIQLPLHA